MDEHEPDGRRARTDLADMTRDELVRLGLHEDGVKLVRYADRWPVAGTRAERRATRRTLLWFVFSATAGLFFLGVYLFWPSRYVPPSAPGYDVYSWYTPLLGGSIGAALFFLAGGVIAYVKRFVPEELAVQERHDGLSPVRDRATAAAILADTGARSEVRRRSVILRAAGAGAGILGVGTGVFAIGGLIRDPWTRSGDQSSLWHSGWYPASGETVFLRQYTGDPERVVLVRPEDMDAGSMLTVFPFREAERGDPRALVEAIQRSDNAALLIRLRPGTPVTLPQGQQGYGYGDFYAYSKVCTHLGCPAGLYEQQTNILLCPCHQSQFAILDGARPIFGPAVRALPQLPITVDGSGYLVARGDFSAPVGPGFWELGQ